MNLDQNTLVCHTPIDHQLDYFMELSLQLVGLSQAIVLHHDILPHLSLHAVHHAQYFHHPPQPAVELTLLIYLPRSQVL